ncbi:unnamed protein product [Ixodes pacificus]
MRCILVWQPAQKQNTLRLCVGTVMACRTPLVASVVLDARPWRVVFADAMSLAMSKHRRAFSDRISCGARFGGMVLGAGDETRIEWLMVWQRLIVAGPPQEMLLRRNLTEEILPSPTSPPTSDGGVGPTTDPFLGGDFHSRQESADSGLGLGPNYSLPHTPEDFLSSMDDSIDAGLNDDPSHQNSELSLDGLQGTGIDMGTENMDSDDLVPSLQEELQGDLLSDMEALLTSSKDSVLTWL